MGTQREARRWGLGLDVRAVWVSNHLWAAQPAPLSRGVKLKTGLG
jgi:hypothetical protein